MNIMTPIKLTKKRPIPNSRSIKFDNYGRLYIGRNFSNLKYEVNFLINGDIQLKYINKDIN